MPFWCADAHSGDVPPQPDGECTDAEGVVSVFDEERAAIIEYGAGVPREWAEGYARLHPDRPPRGVPLGRWQRFVDDVGRFLDGGWAAEAWALGWGPLDLFGCDRERPFAGVDHAGLLWLLDGRRLVELDRHRAVIETATGSRLTFRRRPVSVEEVAFAWDASSEFHHRSS